MDLAFIFDGGGVAVEQLQKTGVEQLQFANDKSEKYWVLGKETYTSYYPGPSIYPLLDPKYP